MDESDAVERRNNRHIFHICPDGVAIVSRNRHLPRKAIEKLSDEAQKKD